MKTVVVYPGRFHPFHRGHKASYDHLVKTFGDGNVFIVSSDKQDPATSPFSFADKMVMMTKLGIAPGHIAQVVNPYQAREITQEIDDPENTVLIFAVSEKDMSGPDARFKFGVKKDGSPSYLQPLPDNNKKLQPMTKHAYVTVTPTVNFKVRGADANSASQIRKLYIAGNEADREQIIADLYGEMDADLKDIFDRKLGQPKQEIVQESIDEAWLINDPERGHQIAPDGGMGTWDEATLVSNLSRKFADIVGMLKNKNYKGVEYVLYQAGAMESMVKALSQYEQFMGKQGQRPIARGRTVDMSVDESQDYVDEATRR